jgi:hypothetical protein
MENFRHNNIFRFYNILFTIGGSPFYMSYKLYAVYTLAAFLTGICEFISNILIVYVHRSDMDVALEDSLPIFILLSGMCIQFIWGIVAFS